MTVAAFVDTYPRGGCSRCARNVTGIGDSLIAALAWRTLAAWYAGPRDGARVSLRLFCLASDVDQQVHRGDRRRFA